MDNKRLLVEDIQGKHLVAVEDKSLAVVVVVVPSIDLRIFAEVLVGSDSTFAAG